MTYDPLKIIERPKMGMFSGLPSAAPGTVLVIDREGHPVRVLAGPGDRLTAGEVRWGQVRTLYEVDVTEHPLEFRDAFPCKDDIGGFRATVNLTCRVADSAAVVIRGIHDAARVLLPPVTETLRRVCGGFAAEDYQEAEKAGWPLSAAWKPVPGTTAHSGSARSISSLSSMTQPQPMSGSAKRPPATLSGRKTPPCWTRGKPNLKPNSPAHVTS